MLAGPGNGLGGASSRTGCPVCDGQESPPRTGGEAIWS